MRIVFVILTGIGLIFTIGTGWYLSQTLVLQIAYGCEGLITATEEGASLLNLVEWANILWGPLLIILVIVWMIASAQARDVESEIYG